MYFNRPSLQFLRAVPALQSGSMRLFCIPYAGGSASLYRNWTVSAPDWLQVCPIELPGRGWLSSESLATSLIELAQAITCALYPYTDVPYAIFGHSMGALLAYEIALGLESLGRHQLCRLFVSGSPAPFAPRKKPRVSHLPDTEFVEHLRELQGTPEKILAEPELMKLFLPVLRSDFALCEGYRFRHTDFLKVALTTLSGEQDEDASEADMQLWRRVTSGEFRTLKFPGGHFFVKENGVMRAVCKEIEEFRDQRKSKLVAQI